jgi:putative aldouronate transport system substrate-binding protein
MNHQPSDVSRRALLGALAAGAGTLVSGPLLSGCGSNGQPEAKPNPEGAIREQQKLTTVPKLVNAEYVKPELAAGKDVAPGYLAYPREPIRTVSGKPGAGSTFKAMTPAWWPIPPGLDKNDYYKAVNADLGSTFEFTIINGNDYGTKIAATLASKKIPDVMQVPVWNRPQDFSSAIVPALFADLTDFLGKDISKKWPNLANLPTKSWQACVFGGRLFGLPSPGGGISDGLFYRSDIFAELGVEPPKTADDWLALCKEVNDPKGKRWACGTVFAEIRRMYGIPANWMRRDGKLVNVVETEEYLDALEFNRKLFAAGYVHPTVVSGGWDVKPLFEGGQMLMYMDGVGAWHEALDRQRPSKPDFKMLLFPPFSADGTTKPVYTRGGAARMQSYIKKDTPNDKIEELLGAMNYICAPFGTREYEMITYGPEGKTHTKDSNGVPALNDKGKQQVTFTYGFLIGRPPFISKPPYPDYVQDFYAWQQATAPFMIDDLLDGLNVEEPPKFQTLQQPLTDKEADISRGRAKVSDWTATVANWRKRGGDELRAFYDENLKKIGR